MSNAALQLRRLLIAACGLLLWLGVPALPADAALICRWVDDAGLHHAADMVPDKYVASADCEDSATYRQSADELRQAQRQALEWRRQANQSAGTAQAPPPAPAVRASSAGPPRRPARGVDESTDCDTWRHLYRESLACFAPYRTVHGVKAEAFEKCTAIASPEPKCGAPAN